MSNLRIVFTAGLMASMALVAQPADATSCASLGEWTVLTLELAAITVDGVAVEETTWGEQGEAWGSNVSAGRVRLVFGDDK